MLMVILPKHVSDSENLIFGFNSWFLGDSHQPEVPKNAIVEYHISSREEILGKERYSNETSSGLI